MDTAWEASTKHTYENIIGSLLRPVELRLEAKLLPMDSYDKLVAAFASQSGKHWSQIRLLKASIRAWHSSRNISDPFDNLWDERALKFWVGLKKSARHEGHAKRPVELGELSQFVKLRVQTGTEAGIRDANMANVCFFGVRRSKEMLSLS